MDWTPPGAASPVAERGFSTDAPSYLSWHRERLLHRCPGPPLPAAGTECSFAIDALSSLTAAELCLDTNAPICPPAADPCITTEANLFSSICQEHLQRPFCFEFMHGLAQGMFSPAMPFCPTAQLVPAQPCPPPPQLFVPPALWRPSSSPSIVVGEQGTTSARLMQGTAAVPASTIRH